MKRVCSPLTLATFWVLAAPALGVDTCDAPTSANAQPHELYRQLPLQFEANQGQTNAAVRYLARGSGYALFLTSQESVLVLRAPEQKGKAPTAEVLRFHLKGANPSPTVEGAEQLEGKANYFIGNDPTRWHTDVPLYGRVRVGEVYPGVNLTYYGNQRQLEYDFVVAPGADPRAIRLRVEGARSLRLDGEGNLALQTRHGEVVQRVPTVYQVRDGARKMLEGRFRIHGKREIGFEVPAYDRSLALVIDPVVLWSVYLGGTGADSAEAVAVEDRGTQINTYVTGSTFSPNFPLNNAVDSTLAGQDAFVTRFQYNTAPVSLSLFYSTYLGGTGSEQGLGIAFDVSSQAYVTGSTTSTDFPRTVGPAGNAGGTDAFVTKLSSSGSSLIYSRYLGGNGTDIGHDIAVDRQNDAYIVGETTSTNLPIAGTGFLTNPHALIDGFVTKIDAAGGPGTFPFALFSTYVGGTSDDRALGVALQDQSPSFVGIQVVGDTRSADFPTKAPVLQASLKGTSDAFVTVFQSSGGSPSNFPQLFGTYLGGGGDESANAVAFVDDKTFSPAAPSAYWGIYVAGQTSSDDFPTRDPFQPTRRGNFDGFVTKIQIGGGLPLLYSTHLGGINFDSIADIAVDQDGFAYLTGSTASGTTFPTVRPLQASQNGPTDAFVTKLVPTGCSVMYSTWWGGSQDESGNGIGVTPAGIVSVVGKTSSGDFFTGPLLPSPPVRFNSFQGGATDAFVTSINDTGNADVQLTKADSPDPVLLGQPLTYTLTLTNLSAVFPAYGITLTDPVPSGATFVSATPSANCSLQPGPTVKCDFPCLGPSQLVNVVITVTPNVTGLLNNSASITTLSVDPPGNNTASASTTVNPAADLTTTKTATPATADVGSAVIYTITVKNNGPSTATGVKAIDTMPPGVSYESISGAGVSCNPPPASVVTCNITASLGPAASFTFNIVGRATAPGLQTNKVRPAANEADPDSSNDLASADTLVGVPGTALVFLTARSSGGAPSNSGQNFLEWFTPSGPAAILNVHRTAAPALAPCPYETNPANLATQIDSQPFMANVHDFFLDDNGGSGLTNNITYCYTVFLTGGGAPANGSPRFISGRPFNSVIATPGVRWAFNTGTWSMAPPGNGVGMIHAVSNDNALYAMTKGAGGGKWPGPVPQWLPFSFMTQPSQGRPSTYPLPVGTASQVVFLSSQDGRVYAVDAQNGGAASPPWISGLLGTTVFGTPSGIFRAFGGTRDLILVGSRETPPTQSKFYALKLTDGTYTALPGWSTDGSPLGKIGPIHGQAAVDYTTVPPRVYFASRQFGPTAPNNNTLWCVDLETSLPIWAKPYGDIDAGVTVRGSRLYIATNAGTVQAVDANNGNTLWSVPFAITPAAEGPAKGFVFAPVGSSDLFLASKNRIWSLRDAGTSYVENWAAGGVAVNSPSTPIVVPGETSVYVGSADGNLQLRDIATGVFSGFFPLGDLKAAVGSPTFDLRNGFIYVGTEAGIIYALDKTAPEQQCVSSCVGKPFGRPCSLTAPSNCFCMCDGAGNCVGGC